jgi:hypothetical protein
MSPVHVRLNVALLSLVWLTAVASAQQQFVRPAVGVKSAYRAAGDVVSLISGVVVDGEQKPLRGARVRLRNLDVNEIEQVATADELGEFSFTARPGVPYVVEIADQNGRVVAVGDVVRSAPGEVAGTIVVLSSKMPSLAGLFSNTARTVMTAATAAGLSVVDETQPKLSPTK